MELKDHIAEIQVALRAGLFPNEAAVKQGIVLCVLQAMGWPVFDFQTVWPEYNVQGTRVDFALCHPQGKPAVFIEVKQVGQSEGADRQLFEYAFHSGVPMAVLTDGQEWHFYLPGERGDYEERRIYKLDLIERDTEESVRRLERYLSCQRVCSGEALASAREDYANVTRIREIEATLPRAWRKLVEEQESLLIDLIADEVESLCGYKPEPDSVASFLATQLQLVSRPVPPAKSEPDRRPQIREPALRSGAIGFILQGREFPARSAREVLINVLNELSSRDPGFLERFAARRHGRRRRYVARTREELYPDRPDLCRDHSHRLNSGWWVGLNYSKESIRRILEMACEVSRLRFGSDLKVSLG